MVVISSALLFIGAVGKLPSASPTITRASPPTRPTSHRPHPCGTATTTQCQTTLNVRRPFANWDGGRSARQDLT
jgi:hypothetical protein